MGVVTAMGSLGSADSDVSPVASEVSAVEILSGDLVEMATTSSAWQTISSSPTTATGTVFLSGACPAAGVTVEVLPMPGVPNSSVDASTQTDGSVCRLDLSWPEIGLRDRASGHFLVTVGDREPIAVAYDITRSSSLDVFVWISAVALLAGLAATWMLWTIFGTGDVPEDWSFKEAYASTFTGLVVAAAALLAATGVLDEYAPQYSVAGPFAATLVVGLLLLVGPLLFSMAKKDNQTQRRRMFAVAGGVAILAAVAQLGLVVLVIISGSWPGWAKLVIAVGAVLSLAVLFLYAARQAWLLEKGHFRGSGKPEEAAARPERAAVDGTVEQSR
ncbi:hypothetical protein [Geodermatophilus sp. CPCC 205506]|uniref:hypothetical protein n=1 Tax=Geodermatophilus sp. CPCC 205506 TaxID=2936596 RepID=UPI003EED9820